MAKSKPVAKTQKAVTAKKVTVRNNTSSTKPAKLGGVPNQGSLS